MTDLGLGVTAPAVPAVPADQAPADVPARRRRSWSFDTKVNGLNWIRLVLGTMVLVAHAFPLSGTPGTPVFADTDLGAWAVVSFFAISGYLITGSRIRSSFHRFLTMRVARIFPAYLVCLVVVAFGFAPVAYLRDHGTLSGFLTAVNTPFNYIAGNLTLRINDFSVAGTLGNVPFPGAWNGSLWTLYYEFLCYMIVGVLCFVPLFRRSRWGIVAAFAVSALAQVFVGYAIQVTGNTADAVSTLRLLPYFLGGAVVYVLRDRIPLNAPVALGSLGVALGATWWEPAWGGQVTAPLLVVFLLWLANVVPGPLWIRENDLSYGLYIYAFPTQQLLARARTYEAGLATYITAALVGALALAALSWFLVEKPVLAHARTATRQEG